MPLLTDRDLYALGEQHNAITEAKERAAFYAAHLYPALRDRFLALPPADPPVEILLLPVSQAHAPILTAARWKPRVAFAIYSTLSQRHQSFIEEQITALGLNIIAEGRTVEGIEIEPGRLYTAIKEILQPYLNPGNDNAHIALERVEKVPVAR